MARVGRRQGVNAAPVPPPEFAVDAEVQAVHCELIGDVNAAEWRRRADITATWARDNDVNLYPELGGKVFTRWVYDDATGTVVRNLGQLSGPYCVPR